MDLCAGVAVLLDILDATAMERIALLRTEFIAMNEQLQAEEEAAIIAIGSAHHRDSP